MFSYVGVSWCKENKNCKLLSAVLIHRSIYSLITITLLKETAIFQTSDLNIFTTLPQTTINYAASCISLIVFLEVQVSVYEIILLVFLFL